MASLKLIPSIGPCISECNPAPEALVEGNAMLTASRSCRASCPSKPIALTTEIAALKLIT
eukprot:5514550-Karenia_brevis.AAC.1